jgi:S-formylglutathione hydrolase
VGNSAGYYINATSEATKKHFQMFTYINEELPEVVSSFFPVSKENKSITGFSMGGHGALISALKTGKFRSVSAFAPMANPSKSASWGIKAWKFFFNNVE